jgi:hypothetical protein
MNETQTETARQDSTPSTRSRVPADLTALTRSKSSGTIASYYPDFIVKTTDGTVWIVETKGQEDIDVMPKWKRLVDCCADASAQDERPRTMQGYLPPEHITTRPSAPEWVDRGHGAYLLPAEQATVISITPQAGS